MIPILRKYRIRLSALVLLSGAGMFATSQGLGKDNGDFPVTPADHTPPCYWDTGDPLPLWRASSYPLDPTADISWSCQYTGVEQIKCAFDHARTAENNQLGTTLPMITLPGQATWDAMDEGEKALWLINQERSARGIEPLEQIEANVTGVAQTYADYLLENDLWGHTEDGRSPWERLEDNPVIGACHDNLSVAENLAVFVSSETIQLPVERSVYIWMYDDASSNWGHRHAILWYPYTDNSGLPGREGLLGIGRASGGPYQGPFADVWPFAEMIVMNVFDPCSIWEYDSTTTSSPSSSTTTTTSTVTTSTTPATTTEQAGCSLGIEPASVELLSKQSITFTVHPHGDCHDPDYEWLVQTSIGSSCDHSGAYTAGLNPDRRIPVTDRILVVDHANGDISVEATVSVHGGCPAEYLYGDSSEEVLLLRWLRDRAFTTTPHGKQMIELYYRWSPVILRAMEENETLRKEIQDLVDLMVALLRADNKPVNRLEEGR